MQLKKTWVIVVGLVLVALMLVYADSLKGEHFFGRLRAPGLKMFQRTELYQSVVLRQEERSETVYIPGTHGDWNNWLDTGIDLIPGRTYTISVSGTICFYPDQNCIGGTARVDAWGYCRLGRCTYAQFCTDYPLDCDITSPDYPFYAFPHAVLMARQGEGNDWNRIFKAIDWRNGERPNISVSERLYLTIADLHAHDNNGGFNVTISW